jgi:hypothetical protein
VKRDPLALAIFGAALALLFGLLLYVFFVKAPEPAPPGRGLVEQARQAVDNLRKPAAEVPPAKPAPVPAARPATHAPKPAAPVAQTGVDAGYPVWPPPAGMTWTYRVSLEPQLWQDAVLVYRVTQQGGALVVDTDFRHAKGNMAFRLGSFRAGDPAHANTRFPGFFLYPAYFGDKLRVGQVLAWEWPWQLPGGGARPGRVKRFEGRVVASEQYHGPVFPMASMLRIEGALSYIEDGRVQASARETLWYAGKAAQLVRLERDGRTPDEGATRIVAELVEMR